MTECTPQGEQATPTVSVIIPAKNESRWLPQCLDALIQQNASACRLEIIVVDNGSTDNTVQIAQERGALVLHEPTLNVAGLRNYGVSKTSGSILGFVDADVVVSEGWLEAALNCLGEDPIVGCVGSFPDVPKGFGWVAESWSYLQTPSIRDAAKAFEIQWLPSMNMIMRKEAFERVKGFRTELVTCEDVDFCFRLGQKQQILYCAKMKALHYGEASDLGHLFRKERWRALGNYDGIRHHGLKRDEIPSLLLPLYYMVVSPWLAVSLVSLSWLGVLGALVAGIAPPVTKAFLCARQFRKYLKMPHISLVCFVYCVARTAGALDWLRSKVFR